MSFREWTPWQCHKMWNLARKPGPKVQNRRWTIYKKQTKYAVTCAACGETIREGSTGLLVGPEPMGWLHDWPCIPKPSKPTSQPSKAPARCEYRRCGTRGYREVKRPWIARQHVRLGSRKWHVCEHCANLLIREGGRRA